MRHDHALSLFVTVLVTLALGGPVMADTEDQSCTMPPAGFGIPNATLPEAERVVARETERRARMLADSFLAVEAALSEVGMDPNSFSTLGLSWVGIVRDEDMVIGVYRLTDEGLIREHLFQTESRPELVERLDTAQWALAHTPTPCSMSHGLLDAGITDQEGKDLLYAIRLLDRQQDMSLGVHYRFVVDNGVVQPVERLGVNCRLSKPLSLAP